MLAAARGFAGRGLSAALARAPHATQCTLAGSAAARPAAPLPQHRCGATFGVRATATTTEAEPVVAVRASLSPKAAATAAAFRRSAGASSEGLGGEGGPPLGRTSAAMGAKLRALAKKQLDEAFGSEEVSKSDASIKEERSEAATAMASDTQKALDLLDSIEAGRRERKGLQDERADMLAVGFQTTTSENKEFAALVVCATAGIFAVSIHWSFFSIFAVSYMIYRSALKQVRIQHDATTHLQEVIDRLHELDSEDVKNLAAFRACAVAWSAVDSE